MSHNPYTILEVEPSATPAQIKKAYLQMAKIHHPDAGGSTEQFALVSWAYELLSDPAARAYYDQTGGERPQQPDATAKLAGLIIFLWEQVLSEPGEVKHKDLIDRMKTLCHANVSGIRRQVKEASKMRKDFKAMKARLSYTGKSVNPLEHWVDKNLGAVGQSILSYRDELLVYRQVAVHIEDYNWQWEEKPKPKESQMWSQVWYDEGDRIPEKYTNMFKDPRR